MIGTSVKRSVVLGAFCIFSGSAAPRRSILVPGLPSLILL